MKQTIEVFGKNMALVARREIECECVPRVGDVVDLPADIVVDTGGLNTAMVIEVVWALKKNGMDAVVKCRAWGGSASQRLIELESNGWLQPRD